MVDLESRERNSRGQPTSAHRQILNPLCSSKAPKARKVKAWASGPGSKDPILKSRALKVRDGCPSIHDGHLSRPFRAQLILGIYSRGVAPGYYISRLQRENHSPLTHFLIHTRKLVTKEFAPQNLMLARNVP